ncbi:DUF1810 domain-containing protein [Chryseobacterium sp.]|uniref:DUF1810 domain-containing protein n=1 Tax=Chryseobacterium sp. TaxID=1871047 RepID=UPI0011CC84AE|nr:DUF1810 domain-containing protein [Chryseobacterium sp.]TXF79209.1 DUF1810 domain-containing protein [Chryseobacterium sp.]
MLNNLQRFLDAQANTYETALREVRSGHKNSHWMWFVFPQIKGLGFSEISKLYAIENAAEAKAYLEHPILGLRLREISQVLLELPVKDAHAVFGSPDDLKLKSCMTLFAAADSEPDNIFRRVLERYFKGKEDPATLEKLAK